MIRASVILSLSAFHFVFGDIANLKGFDDTVLFKINWPGKSGTELLENLNDAESMVVTSSQQEKYRCYLPVLKEKEKTSDEDYLGPNPIELLTPVFQQSTCTTLLESYWTYELCHGRYIRQYHEEREGKKVKLQEYYLGKWDKKKTALLSSEFDKEKEEGRPLVPPLKKLDGVSLPYLQLNFTDGTLCDLNGKPRRTNVLYVCFASGKNDIFIIKETSTCEYEVIVISSELCKHPKYRPQVTGENDINCLPLENSPTKPLGLMKMEAEGFKQRHFSAFGDSKNDKMFAVYSIDEFKDKDGRMQVTVELRPLDGDEVDAELPSALDENESPVSPISMPPLSGPVVSPPPEIIPDVPIEVNDFLRGKTCPQGGYGWWVYKFCYGDYIEQYHVEKGKPASRQSIILGQWNKEKHLEWLKKNPNKRPKPITSRTFITQFYSGGDVCEETGKPREIEVKLKCVENRGSVSFYVLEPQPCQYILGFESSLICDFIHKVNDDALLE